MNINHHHFLLLILGLNLTIGLSYDVAYSQSSVKLYSIANLGLTFEYPPSWLIVDNSSNYNSISEFQLLFVPEQGNNNNTIIDLSVLDVGNYSLNEYSKFSKDLHSNDPDIQDMKVNMTSNKLGNLDSPALNLTYTVTNENSTRLSVQEISTISNQSLYTVTLVAPEDDVDLLLPSFLTVTSSIRIS